MKFKKHAALSAAAALANTATAQDGAYGREQKYYLPEPDPPGFRPTPPTPPIDSRPSPRRNIGFDPSQGAAVAPGQSIKSNRQRLRKERERERQQSEGRTDSVIDNLDGQADDPEDDQPNVTMPDKPAGRGPKRKWYDTQHNWAALKAKLADRAPDLRVKFARLLEPMDPRIEERVLPAVNTGIAFRDPVRNTYRYNTGAILITTIVFLLLFGTLHILSKYLPSFPRASACSITTVYIPITYTMTPDVPVGNSTTPDITYTSTMTHTSMITETLTVTASSSDSPAATSTAVDPTTAGPSYAYTVNSAGQTEWVNGMSPSSGATLATVTSTIIMQPVPPQDDSATTIQSTEFSTETVTPPPYTSTVYSFISPDLTSTSTSTHYVTYTLSEVTPAASITTTRTSFSGISSGGWNASSSTESVASEQTEGPTTTTITVISYYGTGTKTTSTYTTLITTTVQSAYTTTISQVVESSISGGRTTTLTTGVPVTITPGSNGVSFSTSVTAPETNSVLSQSSGATVNPAATSGSTATLPLLNSTSTSALVPYPLTTSGSSGPASAGPQTAGNATIPSNSQSLSGGSSGTVSSVSSADSITHTMSAAALSGRTSSSMSSQSIGSPSVSTFTTGQSPAQITNTVSSTESSVSPRFSANATNSMSSKSHRSSGSSDVSAGPVTTRTSSSRLSRSISFEPANTGRPLSNSTTSSTPYGYATPSAPSASDSGSQTPEVSIPSPSIPTRSPPPLTSGSSSPSTLETSARSKSSRPSETPAVLSPTSVISTPFSLASVNGTSTSHSGRTSRSKSSSPATKSTTNSAESNSSGRFTIQTSLPSSKSATPTANATNPFSASSATSTPSAGCGEQGDFTANFDDLPRFLPAGNQTQPDITQAPPVPNPYHHLTFSDGYVYAPQPKEPYQPSSPPHLAVFLANATGKTASPFGDLVKPGEVGDGPRESISAFWFDAKSAFFGCDNLGPAACTLVLSAYTWSPFANAEILTYAQNVTVPACPSLTSMNCQLQKVEFPESFRGLSGLQVQAYTGNDQRMFFMDDLAMRWSNSSCAAGLLRQSSS